jgi:hypothetical protein
VPDNDIQIPQHLTDLQTAADTTRAAIGAHQRTVNKPALDWTDEENARTRELWAAATTAAEALRAAINDSGLEKEHGSYAFHRALRAKMAAKETATGQH